MISSLEVPRVGKVALCSGVLVTYFPRFSPSSKVSGIAMPQVSGRNMNDKAAMRDSPPKVANGID